MTAPAFPGAPAGAIAVAPSKELSLDLTEDQQAPCRQLPLEQHASSLASSSEDSMNETTVPAAPDKALKGVPVFVMMPLDTVSTQALIPVGLGLSDLYSLNYWP